MTHSSSSEAGKGARVLASGGPGPIYGTEGPSNTFYGQGTGGSIFGGTQNAFFGFAAGFSDNTGAGNSFFGYRAGYSNTTAGGNSFFGNYAGYKNDAGLGNSYFGNYAGYNTTASFNSFFGNTAGYNNTTGNGNSFFGNAAGSINTTGASNSFFGSNTGYNNTAGQSNSFFGVYAGSANTTENNNSFFGAYSDGAAGITNGTAIGYRAKVTQSNSLVLGGVNGVNGATAETNVGIGVTNPDRQLTVEGSQALGRFRRFNDTTSGHAAAFVFERARGTQASPADMQAGDWLGKLQFHGRVGGSIAAYGAFSFVATDTSQNGRYAFFDRDLATERMSILNTGNVGIGTSSPTERLHVVGNLRVTGSIVYGAPETDIPDYVFDPGYKLLPIGELEQFIAKEKHLPNIPRSSEIKEKGLNLSEFQMKLLEKIEELTLYAVEQAKTIRMQQVTLARKDIDIAALKSQNSTLDARVAALEQMMEGLLRQDNP